MYQHILVLSVHWQPPTESDAIGSVVYIGDAQNMFAYSYLWCLGACKYTYTKMHVELNKRSRTRTSPDRPAKTIQHRRQTRTHQIDIYCTSKEERALIAHRTLRTLTYINTRMNSVQTTLSLALSLSRVVCCSIQHTVNDALQTRQNLRDKSALNVSTSHSRQAADSSS